MDDSVENVLTILGIDLGSVIFDSYICKLTETIYKLEEKFKKLRKEN